LGFSLGGIAHEFNNLLSPILGYTELLMINKSEIDLDWNNINQIQIAGNRAKSLIQQMLAYGRQSLSQVEPVKLELLVDETIKFVANTIPSNISIKTDFEMKLPSILGMSNKIDQVILNLCINASQARPAGGTLSIGLQNSGFQKFINLEGLTREGDFVVMRVQDTGSGMDLTILNRIFDPFFTTKEVGQDSGLGLTVVHGIVEQHQNYIEVDSKIGCGTIIKYE